MRYDISEPFNILLVEDESADAHLVRLALKENKVHCRLYHVQDGIEALAFLRHEGEKNLTSPRPDLILTDMNMPRMNGRELLAEIKADEKLSSIPVVVLTTSDTEGDIIASYQSGAAGYITKPVDIDRFVEVIRQLDNYWFFLVRLPNKNGS